MPSTQHILLLNAQDYIRGKTALFGASLQMEVVRLCLILKLDSCSSCYTTFSSHSCLPLHACHSSHFIFAGEDWQASGGCFPLSNRFARTRQICLFSCFQHGARISTNTPAVQQQPGHPNAPLFHHQANAHTLLRHLHTHDTCTHYPGSHSKYLLYLCARM